MSPLYFAGVPNESTSSSSPTESDKFTVLEFTPSTPAGAFRIRGIESDLYLAMDEKGRLYGEKDRMSENALFTEHAQVKAI
jgi:hypothetical protein